MKYLLTSLLLLATLTMADPQTKQCQPERPNLAAGHIQLTDKNYAKWRKDNEKLHILGVSDSSCKDCCHTEQILEKLKEKFDSKVYTAKKGKKIQIGRVDAMTSPAFLEKEMLPVDELPALFIMHDGKYYRYRIDTTISDEGYYEDISGMIHFLNRLQHPLVPLATEDAVESFLDEGTEWVEKTGFMKKDPVQLGKFYNVMKHKTRVLVFMFDKDEYQAEMKSIRESARISAQRLGLRIGLVEDPKLIRLYKAKKG